MKQINIQGFKGRGNWYKGNLHSHTTNSDGILKPEEAVKLYKDNGYHFLCLSEHDLFTDYRQKFDDDDFIILPGIEASAILYEKEDGPGRLKVHHIHGILGNSQMQKKKKHSLFSHNEFLKPQRYYGKWDGALAAQELTDRLLEKGCITIYNHPIWSRVSQEEFINTKGLTALEIYNFNTVNESGTGYDITYWDVMLRKGYKILGTASDDNHNQGLFEDSCGGYIVVKAEKLNHDNIVNAIMEGNYYSSSGPEISDWGISDGIVFVECSPVNRVNFIIGNYLNAGVTVMCREINETISDASYVLTGRESYVRVECIDKYGKTAWTNTIYLN